MQLLQRKELEWTRDMAITNIKFASMLVDFAEHKIVSESGASEYRGFGERLVAYMAAAQVCPISRYRMRLIDLSMNDGTFVSLLFYTPKDQPLSYTLLSLCPLVLATGRGNLLGVNAASDVVLWHRIVAVSSGGPADAASFKQFVTEISVEGPNPGWCLLWSALPVEWEVGS
ncbi:ER membrane protein complex subunit 1 [Ceratobasidium sp. AG-Ba]|nr:ER membrane protein complex subunit 1 [Ceratobasidium sp. AG-Ba]